MRSELRKYFPFCRISLYNYAFQISWCDGKYVHQEYVSFEMWLYCKDKRALAEQLHTHANESMMRQIIPNWLASNAKSDDYVVTPLVLESYQITIIHPKKYAEILQSGA